MQTLASGSRVAATACASGKADNGRTALGIRTVVSSTTPTGKISTISTAGSDQIVERRLRTPTVASRKCPGVAINSAGVDESPNCQTPVPAETAARRNGKSTGMFFRSAAALK